MTAMYLSFIIFTQLDDSQYFSFQGSTNGGSTYAVTITTTVFKHITRIMMQHQDWVMKQVLI
jgi:hypothetical protein